MDPRLNFIYQRRSIRRYQQRPLDPSIIEELLKAAMASPSAKDGQPWRFIVITDQAVKDQLISRHPSGELCAACAAVFVLYGDPVQVMLQQDLAAATQNLLLAASALGLGACWLGMRSERQQPVIELLEIPPDQFIVSMVTVGWPAEQKEARTQYDPAKVFQQKYGSSA